MTVPLDVIRAIHHAFRRDMAAIDASAPNQGAIGLIHAAIGDDWVELARRIPELRKPAPGTA